MSDQVDLCGFGRDMQGRTVRSDSSSSVSKYRSLASVLITNPKRSGWESLQVVQT